MTIRHFVYFDSNYSTVLALSLDADTASLILEIAKAVCQTFSDFEAVESVEIEQFFDVDFSEISGEPFAMEPDVFSEETELVEQMYEQGSTDLTDWGYENAVVGRDEKVRWKIYDSSIALRNCYSLSAPLSLAQLAAIANNQPLPQE